MNRKGVELSINFTVMLILGIVTFIAGLVFVSRLFSGGQDWIRQVPTAENTILDSCIAREDTPICLSKNQKVIPVGRGDAFGLAVINTLGRAESFQANVRFSTGVDNGNNPIAGIDESTWTLAKHDLGVIENKESRKVAVPFKVPAGSVPGQYAFNINVCYKEDSLPDKPAQCPDAQYPDLYESTHKIYITVK